MGGFGSYEKGWDRVRQNTEFAASRFRGGVRGAVEEMAVGESGDLAYAVWIERGEVRVEGCDEPAPLAVRVTHVFRREDGDLADHPSPRRGRSLRRSASRSAR
ncbi:MAG: hypothetical protein E6H96_08430 [Chloroflexi bacterium]|nr:MAG: hypothetical protein E6H96_08430 [Chloroflexota bacterium]